jgi:TRAP transporter TAXI family solute receptor
MKRGSDVARHPGDLSRRSLLFLPSLVVPALLLPASRIAWAQSAKPAAAQRPLVLGTSTPGGGFALYGATLERVLNQHAGRTLLRAKPTRGTTENLTLLERGDIDAALIQGTAASEIFQQGSANRLRILFAMYPSPGMLAVPGASAARKFEDLLNQRVVFGVRTSGLVTLARQVISGIGLDIDHDFDAIYVEQASESPRLVLAGAAAGLWGAGEGWPGFTQLASALGGARFIGPSSVQIKRIVERYPQLTAMEVAAGAYPGIEKPLPTVGSVNFILVRDDFDAARASAFVEAMRSASSDLAAALPQAAYSTLGNTVASAPARELLHPSVLSASR